MKIEVIKAAVDRLSTDECRGTVVNTEALKELREMLSAPVIHRQDALDEARELLERVFDQGDTDGLIGEEISNFLAENHSVNIEFKAEPFGYWLFPKGSPQLGMFHKPDPDIESASVSEVFEIKALYAEQPEIAALRAEFQQRLAYAEDQNAELEKDRDAWRRRSTDRLADCQGMMGALKEIQRDTTDADSKELATKTIAEILRRAKSNERPIECATIKDDHHD